MPFLGRLSGSSVVHTVKCSVPQFTIPTRPLAARERQGQAIGLAVTLRHAASERRMHALIHYRNRRPRISLLDRPPRNRGRQPDAPINPAPATPTAARRLEQPSFHQTTQHSEE